MESIAKSNSDGSEYGCEEVEEVKQGIEDLSVTGETKTVKKKMKSSRQITINTCNALHELHLLNNIIAMNPNTWKGQHLRDKIKGCDIFWLGR